MKLTFTQKEFARLLELVYLGQLVVTEHQGEDTPAARRYAEIEQKLLELATPLGCADMVTVGSDGRLVPSEKLEDDERLNRILAEHANDTFWHELVHRLADRDLAAQQAKKSMSGSGGPPIDAVERVRELEDRYWEEFEKNDLANVVLLKGGKG